MEQSSSFVEHQPFQLYLLRQDFQLDTLSQNHDEEDAGTEGRRNNCGKIELYSHELVFTCSDKFFIRKKSDCIQKSWSESGCAYHGITDLSNTLVKVQHGAVSENSVHNSCVPRTVIWTWRFVLPRQTWRNLRHGLRSNVLWTLEVCQSRITLLSRIWCDCMTAAMRQWHELFWSRVGSRVCCFLSALCRYLLCESVSTAQCRAHTHLYITLQRTCVTCPTTAIFIHSGPACAIQKLRVTSM